MCFRVTPRIYTKKHVSQRNWIVGSEYIYHSRLNSQHNWGNLEAHLISMRIFTLIINKTHLPNVLDEVCSKVPTRHTPLYEPL